MLYGALATILSVCATFSGHKTSPADDPAGLDYKRVSLVAGAATTDRLDRLAPNPSRFI